MLSPNSLPDPETFQPDAEGLSAAIADALHRAVAQDPASVKDVVLKDGSHEARLRLYADPKSPSEYIDISKPFHRLDPVTSQSQITNRLVRSNHHALRLHGRRGNPADGNYHQFHSDVRAWTIRKDYYFVSDERKWNEPTEDMYAGLIDALQRGTPERPRSRTERLLAKAGLSAR